MDLAWLVEELYERTAFQLPVDNLAPGTSSQPQDVDPASGNAVEVAATVEPALVSSRVQVPSCSTTGTKPLTPTDFEFVFQPENVSVMGVVEES